MKENAIVEKVRDIIESSHQSIAKTVSDYGSEIKKNNDKIIELQTTLADFIKTTNKVIDKHEESIDVLSKSDTEIRSAFNSAKWVAGGSIGIILLLGGTVSGLTLYAYNQDLSNVNDKVKELEEFKKTELTQILNAIKNSK